MGPCLHTVLSSVWHVEKLYVLWSSLAGLNGGSGLMLWGLPNTTSWLTVPMGSHLLPQPGLLDVSYSCELPHLLGSSSFPDSATYLTVGCLTAPGWRHWARLTQHGLLIRSTWWLRIHHCRRCFYHLLLFFQIHAQHIKKVKKIQCGIHADMTIAFTGKMPEDHCYNHPMAHYRPLSFLPSFAPTGCWASFKPGKPNLYPIAPNCFSGRFSHSSYQYLWKSRF